MNIHLSQLILDKLKEIENRITNIETEIIYIKSSTQNMDNHISFVEKVYDSIKMPFHYIMDKVSISTLPTNTSSVKGTSTDAELRSRQGTLSVKEQKKLK